jgi:hypothetical protein
MQQANFGKMGSIIANMGQNTKIKALVNEQIEKMGQVAPPADDDDDDIPLFLGTNFIYTEANPDQGGGALWGHDAIVFYLVNILGEGSSPTVLVDTEDGDGIQVPEWDWKGTPPTFHSFESSEDHPPRPLISYSYTAPPDCVYALYWALPTT